VLNVQGRPARHGRHAWSTRTRRSSAPGGPGAAEYPVDPRPRAADRAPGLPALAKRAPAPAGPCRRTRPRPAARYQLGTGVRRRRRHHRGPGRARAARRAGPAGPALGRGDQRPIPRWPGPGWPAAGIRPRRCWSPSTTCGHGQARPRGLPAGRAKLGADPRRWPGGGGRRGRGVAAGRGGRRPSSPGSRGVEADIPITDLHQLAETAGSGRETRGA